MANPRPHRAPGKVAALFAVVLWAAAIATAHADTSLASPSSCSGQWNYCTRAFADDTSRATAGVDKTGEWRGYGFSIPSDDLIQSVRVRADFYASRTNGYLQVQVSADGGASYGPARTVGGNTGERSFFIDVTNDASWTPGKLSDANLRVKATCIRQGGTYNPSCRLDWIPVEVIFTSPPVPTPAPTPTPPPFDFSLSVSPSSSTVEAGQTASTAVTVVLLSGDSQTVALSHGGCPPGATCSFNPVSGLPTFNSTFTVATTSSTPAGNYTITIIGTGGGLNRTATYLLSVTSPPPPPPPPPSPTPTPTPPPPSPPFDFSVSVSPTNGSVSRGNTTSTLVTVPLLSGDSQTVALSQSGCPPSGFCWFTNTTGFPTYTSLFYVYANFSTPTEFYPITITGTGGGLSRSAVYSLTVT